MIKQRKWIHGVFGEKSALKSLDVIQRRETYVLLTGLMSHGDTSGVRSAHKTVCPSTYGVVSFDTGSRHISAMVLESIYGHRITSLEDEYVTLMSRAMQATVAMGVAGATPPDVLPIREFQQTFSGYNRRLSFASCYSEVYSSVVARHRIQAHGAAR